MQLSAHHQKDTPTIKRLRTEGVLKDIERSHLPDDGDEIIACSDGERIVDLLHHHRQLHRDGRNCHHSILLNSGPLLIPVNSPTAQHGEGEIILEHAAGGQRLKQVKTIHLYGHWPCGAAGEAHLSIEDCLTLLAEAKVRTIAFFTERTGHPPRVIPLFHIHYLHEDNRHRSYYFDRHRFANYVQVQITRRQSSAA